MTIQCFVVFCCVRNDINVNLSLEINKVSILWHYKEHYHPHTVNKSFTCHNLGWHCPLPKWLSGIHYSLQGWWNGGSQEPWGPRWSLWNQWQSEADHRRDQKDILRVTTAVICVILHKHAHIYFYFSIFGVIYPPPSPKPQVSEKSFVVVRIK